MILFNRLCIVLVKDYETFNASSEYCRSHYHDQGADLVTIGSAAENTAVARLARNKDLWIGYYHYNPQLKDGKGWGWIPDDKQNGYTNWSPGEPDGIGGHGSIGPVNCALIWGEDTDARPLAKGLISTWDDRGCNCKKWFVCGLGKLSRWTGR